MKQISGMPIRMNLKADKKKVQRICLISSVPVTLLSFYGGLIKRLNEEYAEVTLVSSDLPELYRLESELGITIFATEIARRVTPLQDLVSIFKLYWFLHCEKFDIVHTHTPKGGLIGMISSFSAGIANRVYTLHGLLLENKKGLRRFLLWLVEWLTCRLATSVLAVSPSLRQCAIDEGVCPVGKIQVLGEGSACGLDLRKFTWSESLALAGRKTRANYNIPDDAIVIGFVGRVVPDKGIKTLVKAFERLQREVAESYLLLIGEFETVRETLDAKTMDIIKNNKHIIYNGQFTDDVLPFYAAMDIVTLPSRREGFGLTLIEAAALELPTIATKIVGCVDAVADNITGLLVKVDNSDQLFNAMLRLVKDPELRRQLGKQGRQRVEALFDSRLLIDKHINLYEELIDKNVGC